MNIASWLRATAPLAKGQMPASARNSVDLPLPEGPCSSTRAPGCACTLVCDSSSAPPGSARFSFAISIAADSLCASAGLSRVAALIASSKLVRRSVVARHAARLA